MPPLDPDLVALQNVRDAVERASTAQLAFEDRTQAQVDAVCKAMVQAAAGAAHDLAKLAVEETGMGRVHYKVLKNLFATEGTWASIQDEKTVGIVAKDERRGVLEIATPAGVIAGVVPTTNPTSTAIFKALIAVKGRNSIVISPHPRARRCIGETVEVLRRAIERAGAPADLVVALANPTVDSTAALMRHKKVALILATGGSGLVKAAYSSGKPAYGVGPGNVPVYVDRSADLEAAARAIVASQSFDNGTLCCSEQALVLDRPIAERLLALLKKRGAHLCNEEETAKLAKRCNVNGVMCPDVVGQDPWRVAELAGFQVPKETTVLLAHQGGVGPKWPLSIEILAPVLSVHLVDGWEEGCEVSLATLRYGGLGHTIGLWAKDERVLQAWFLEKPANRILVNGPTSQGAVGFSTYLVPSMSLGCGPQAGNITSDNITARHLVNIKRAAFPRSDWEAIERESHARVARLTGDAAPRGSGLPGDPGLVANSGGGAGRAAPAAAPARPADAGASRETGWAASNWQGNPPLAPRASAKPASSAPPAEARPQPASGGSAGAPAPMPVAAPRFTTPTAQASASPLAPASGGAESATAVLVPPRTRAPATYAADRARPASGANVGSTLSLSEIQGILAHAGRGCPLGPCRTCSHHDAETGVCHA
jgi:acyl-CoA reductase-like NAD-dependent aldehyde dehydrogenase